MESFFLQRKEKPSGMNFIYVISHLLSGLYPYLIIQNPQRAFIVHESQRMSFDTHVVSFDIEFYSGLMQLFSWNSIRMLEYVQQKNLLQKYGKIYNYCDVGIECFGRAVQWCESVNRTFCLTLCDPMDYMPPGSSVHRIFQAGISGVRQSFPSPVVITPFTLKAKMKLLLGYCPVVCSSRLKNGSISPFHKDTLLFSR